MEENVAWLGLDAHAKSCLLAWMDEQGQRRGCWRFPTSESQLIKHLDRVPARIKHLAIEECGLGRWLAQVAQSHVSDVIVCDPRENYRISRHHHKCDEEDGYGLAHLNRLGALKKVWQPTQEHRAVFKCAAQAYLEATQRQSALKVQLKAHFRQWGIIVEGSRLYSATGRECYLSQVQQPGVRSQLELVYQVLDSATEVQGKARRLMVQLGKSYPEIQWVRTVPGVGCIGAHLFVAYIQEPMRFERDAQRFRYSRLGIRDRSSDGKPLGYEQLDRTGHGVLKAIAYRAWLVAAKRRQGPVYAFYQASLRRTADETHARLNTERKVLSTMLALWKKKTVFDPERFLGKQPQLTAKAPCS